jgi:predicted HTH domain antitoxin
MSEIRLTVPDETLMALKGDSESVAAELRRLSSGAAAILAGIPRTLFLTKLADHGVPTFHLTKEDLQRDFEHA